MTTTSDSDRLADLEATVVEAALAYQEAWDTPDDVLRPGDLERADDALLAAARALRQARDGEAHQ